MTTHTLTITGGKKTFGISASCSCGAWSRYMNTTVLRQLQVKKIFLNQNSSHTRQVTNYDYNNS
jgi:hypothetical protein